MPFFARSRRTVSEMQIDMQMDEVHALDSASLRAGGGYVTRAVAQIEASIPFFARSRGTVREKWRKPAAYVYALGSATLLRERETIEARVRLLSRRDPEWLIDLLDHPSDFEPVWLRLSGAKQSATGIEQREVSKALSPKPPAWARWCIEPSAMGKTRPDVIEAFCSKVSAAAIHVGETLGVCIAGDAHGRIFSASLEALHLAVLMVVHPLGEALRWHTHQAIVIGQGECPRPFSDAWLVWLDEVQSETQPLDKSAAERAAAASRIASAARHAGDLAAARQVEVERGIASENAFWRALTWAWEMGSPMREWVASYAVGLERCCWAPWIVEIMSQPARVSLRECMLARGAFAGTPGTPRAHRVSPDMFARLDARLVARLDKVEDWGGGFLSTTVRGVGDVVWSDLCEWGWW